MIKLNNNQRQRIQARIAVILSSVAFREAMKSKGCSEGSYAATYVKIRI
jgi:hypothetical protein